VRAYPTFLIQFSICCLTSFAVTIMVISMYYRDGYTPSGETFFEVHDTGPGSALPPAPKRKKAPLTDAERHMCLGCGAPTKEQAKCTWCSHFDHIPVCPDCDEVVTHWDSNREMPCDDCVAEREWKAECARILKGVPR
jgi:hypothetical protein